jgi:uncharacterized protein
MKKVFIIHGFNGKPNSGWRPWLMRELAKSSVYACALPMPKPEAPIKEEWINTISEAIDKEKEEIFLVGHSLGAPAILRYLETLKDDIKIGGAILVSSPVFKIDKKGYEKVNRFLDKPFDFDHIKKVCKGFVVLHGDKDSVVSFSNAEFLSEKLSCNLVPVLEGNHFGDDEHCYELPELLEVILNKLSIIPNS